MSTKFDQVINEYLASDIFKQSVRDFVLMYAEKTLTTATPDDFRRIMQSLTVHEDEWDGSKTIIKADAQTADGPPIQWTVTISDNLP